MSFCAKIEHREKIDQLTEKKEYNKPLCSVLVDYENVFDTRQFLTYKSSY